MSRLAALCLCLLLALPARAGEPVRLLVGLPPGSGVDQMARLLADGLSRQLARPVAVENRTGARGNVAAEEVSRAAPDGTVLGVVSAGTLVFNRHLSRQMGYDPQADLTPISRFAALPFLVLSGPREGARTIGELLENLRAKTGTCGTPGAGTAAHLVLDMLVRTAGARCDFVHYRGAGGAIPDLLDGSLQVYVESAVIGLPLVRDGRARLVAVTSRARSALLPEAPTVGETVPGFEAETWIALMGPRGMAEALVARIEAAATAVARDAAVVNRLRAMAAEPVGGTRGELAATIRAQDSIWGPVARATGVTAD
ncbi:Bug family tripartite tricarboxylate transporter substrate binding protein [Roseococcus sp. DSY-14]|uniref:Bug family tripartite tricarboxylate transporter substrate binding protein n=1 Tax=Roseococcus sp. DSY-14 TaxID=3369650 RepID=UPI00387B2CBF